MYEMGLQGEPDITDKNTDGVGGNAALIEASILVCTKFFGSTHTITHKVS